MKILLVAPPKRALKDSALHPAVGLGYLATALRKAGHAPDIQDSLANKWTVEDVVAHVRAQRPDVVGVTMFSQALSGVRELLAGIKRADRKVVTIVGGPHPTGVPERVLHELPDADFAFAGEGEIGLVRFLDRLQSG